MVIAVVHDIKLDTTVPGNVWIAGNIIGRLVGCYYIGGIGLILRTHQIFQIMHTKCSIWGISYVSHNYSKPDKDLCLVMREKNLDAIPLNSGAKMYASTFLRNSSKHFVHF